MTAPLPLCSVCHVEPHKYRCPSHPTVLTCSLPCYKRHQARASCTGQRNQTTYVKKSQLTTPAGFDHDYNFLTKIERGIKEPARIVADVEGRPAKRRNMGMTGFEQYCARHNINVESAPSGFQKGKENTTRLLKKSRKVQWCVEWRTEHGRRTLGKMIEDEVLEGAYRRLVPRADATRAADEEDPSNEKSLGPTTTQQLEPESEAILEKQPSAQTAQDIPQNPTTATRDSSDDGAVNKASCPTNTASHPVPQDTGPDQHFYLQIPRCLSARPVLAPLQRTYTITQALQGRHILEYPTIYALPYSPDALPESFLSESAYRRELASEVKAVDAAQIARGSDARDAHRRGDRSDVPHRRIKAEEAAEEEETDKQRILEMLKRDLRG